MGKYDWLGWLSSFIVIATIGRQIHKQWRSRSVRDVSKYLFIGQVFADIGFMIYSYLLRNWVFFAVNMALLIENVIALSLTLHLRKINSPAKS